MQHVAQHFAHRALSGHPASKHTPACSEITHLSTTPPLLRYHPPALENRPVPRVSRARDKGSPQQPYGGPMKSWTVRALVLAMLMLCVAGATGTALYAQESQPPANASVATTDAKAATPPAEAKTEANLILPDLGSVSFLGVNGRTLLMSGLIVCFLGLVFGFVMYGKLKNLAVHRSMREISELIYETCKTYLQTQGKFILLLEVFIGIIMIFYFGVLRHYGTTRTAIIILFSLVGIAGSYGVAWFGIRVNTFANSRAAFASLRGKPFPTYDIPLKAGMSIGMLLISTELV